MLLKFRINKISSDGNIYNNNQLNKNIFYNRYSNLCILLVALSVINDNKIASLEISIFCY